MSQKHWTKAEIDRASTEALESRRAHLVAKKLEISNALGRKNSTDEHGNRLDSYAYHEWRDRARGALMYVERELSILKIALRDRNRRANELSANGAPLPASRPHALLLRACRLIWKLQGEGVEFAPEEFALVDEMKEDVRRHLADDLPRAAAPTAKEG